MKKEFYDVPVVIWFDSAMAEHMKATVDINIKYNEDDVTQDKYIRELTLKLNPQFNNVYNPCDLVGYQTTKSKRLVEFNDIRKIEIATIGIYYVKWNPIEYKENINQKGILYENGIAEVVIKEQNVKEYLDKVTDKIEQYVKGKCFDLGIQYKLDFIYPEETK